MITTIRIHINHGSREAEALLRVVELPQDDGGTRCEALTYPQVIGDESLIFHAIQQLRALPIQGKA